MVEKLVLSNINWKTIFDSVNDPLFILDEAYDIVSCNSKALEFYGYSEDEFLEMNLNDIRAPYSREEIEKFIDEKASVFETRHLTKEKIEIPVEVSTRQFFIVDKICYVHSVRDISARKNAEDELRTSEKKYHDIVEFSPLAIFVLSDNHIQFINVAGLKLFGASRPEQVLGKSVFQFIHPDYHKLTAYRVNIMREGMPAPVLEEKIIRLDSSVLDVEVTAKNVDYLGVTSVEVFMKDITLRKRAEERVSFLASLVDCCEDAIVAKTLDGIITYWNKGAEKLYGYTSDEVIGKPISILMPPKSRNEIPGILEILKKGGEINHYETIRKRKEGTLVKVSVQISPIRNSYGVIIGASSIANKI